MELIPLVFYGRRWPGARITGSTVLLPTRSDAGSPEPVSVHSIMTSGKGRDWKAEEPRGFWRTFATLDQEDETQVLDFLHRYGDPDGDLQPGRLGYTDRWHQWGTFLALMMHAWGEPDRDGICRVRSDFVAERVAAAITPRLDDLRLEVGPDLRPVARAGRLGSYMMASAAFMLARETPMRRCDRCSHWFALQRNTARFCSTECRSAAARLRKDQVHGLRA